VLQVSLPIVTALLSRRDGGAALDPCEPGCPHPPEYLPKARGSESSTDFWCKDLFLAFLKCTRGFLPWLEFSRARSGLDPSAKGKIFPEMGSRSECGPQLGAGGGPLGRGPVPAPRRCPHLARPPCAALLPLALTGHGTRLHRSHLCSQSSQHISCGPGAAAEKCQEHCKSCPPASGDPEKTLYFSAPWPGDDILVLSLWLSPPMPPASSPLAWFESQHSQEPWSLQHPPLRERNLGWVRWGWGLAWTICPRSDSCSSPSSKHLSQYIRKLVKTQEQKDALCKAAANGDRSLRPWWCRS